MSPEVAELLQKASRNIAAAERLARDGDLEIAISRAYYALFYVARALLIAEGESYSKHSTVIAMYGARFARTRRLDPRFHRYLLDAFDMRRDADYLLGFAATPENASAVIQWAREFLDAATSFLSSPPST